MSEAISYVPAGPVVASFHQSESESMDIAQIKYGMPVKIVAGFWEGQSGVVKDIGGFVGGIPAAFDVALKDGTYATPVFASEIVADDG